MRESIGEGVAWRRRLGVLLLASSPSASSDPCRRTHSCRRRWNHKQRRRIRGPVPRGGARSAAQNCATVCCCRRHDSKREKLEERERDRRRGFLFERPCLHRLSPPQIRHRPPRRTTPRRRRKPPLKSFFLWVEFWFSHAEFSSRACDIELPRRQRSHRRSVFSAIRLSFGPYVP
ncbi:uncharacterized protein [Arachis hypogaea]|uniref:uncharacterized protein isoform X2 n=1 Tax=Arachis hypogaea TaxID=3818 RepID=UPI000DEC52B4|nr:uncharacterized protein LOC112710395 isoform X2 [Arachis hypogaea]